MELYPKQTFLKYGILPLTFENESVACEQDLQQNPPVLNEEGVSYPLFSIGVVTGPEAALKACQDSIQNLGALG